MVIPSPRERVRVRGYKAGRVGIAYRSCSTFFIEHDNKFSAAFVVLEDNCPTRPISFFLWKIVSMFLLGRYAQPIVLNYTVFISLYKSTDA